MISRNLNINVKDFKYPTATERKDVLKDFPTLTKIDFIYRDPIIDLIDNNDRYGEVINEENLFYWDYCLTNRLALLKDSYLFTKTSYNRGFQEEYKDCTEIEIVNKLLFNYYAEIFYYYFFSTSDIIAQILNLYYEVYYDENKLHISNLPKNINSIEVRNATEDFIKETTDAKKYRNSFAHRFSPNLMDNRSKIREQDDKIIIDIIGNNPIGSDIFIDNIESSLKALKKYLDIIKKELGQKMRSSS